MKQPIRHNASLVVEALEYRQFLSATTPTAHYHSVHFHQGYSVHRHRIPSPIVAPDALVGQFVGTSPPGRRSPANPYPTDTASLTFSKNPTGDFSGVLVLDGGITFDQIIATVRSDGTFDLHGTGGFQNAQLQGVIKKTQTGITLTGTYTRGGSLGYAYGTFSLTKIS